MRKPFPMLIISLFVIIGAWIKRYLIVVPTMSHPFLPVQNVSEEYVVYSPTAVEILVTAASFIIVLLIVSVLAKVFPIIPMWEYEHEQKENE
jgi:molybdopterin-containing oxidoreductase family membrane subunit